MPLFDVLIVLTKPDTDELKVINLLIIICIDDHGFHVSCYGDDQAVTPHLDRLAQEGGLFDRAIMDQP